MSSTADQEGRLRLALVGCGAISDWHATALAAAAPRTAVTACVDPDTERAAAATKRHPGAAVFSSLDDALASDTFDAVDLMVPHHLHEQLATASFAAGKHVLLEKPMAPTLDACDRILLAARAAGTVFMVAENAQYWPEVLIAQELLADGAIGELITARAWHCFPPFGDFYAGDDPWRFALVAAGGGIAIDAGSHWLRPLRMWCGELTEVVAVTGRPLPAMEGESMCRALCRFDSGVVASFDAFLVPGAVANVPLFQLTGTVGEITIDGLGRVRLFDGTEFKGTVVGQGNYLSSYEGEMADFEGAVLDGRTPAAPAEQALGELRGALAMYRSAEAGTWERVWD
ncbi:MAG: Gfo/Idh/MocA family protein [Acidimicrobiia bacterium]